MHGWLAKSTCSMTWPRLAHGDKPAPSPFLININKFKQTKTHFASASLISLIHHVVSVFVFRMSRRRCPWTKGSWQTRTKLKRKPPALHLRGAAAPGAGAAASPAPVPQFLGETCFSKSGPLQVVSIQGFPVWGQTHVPAKPAESVGAHVSNI